MPYCEGREMTELQEFFPVIQFKAMGHAKVVTVGIGLLIAQNKLGLEECSLHMLGKAPKTE